MRSAPEEPPIKGAENQTLIWLIEKICEEGLHFVP